MTILERTVWVSPDGQFHPTEAAAIAYVERIDLVRALTGTITAAEAMDPEDVGVVVDVLMKHFNITKK